MEGGSSGDFFFSNGVIVKCTFSVWLTAASFNAFIGAVGAVLISITLPALRHTHVGAGTLESLGAAGFGLCDIRVGKSSVTSPSFVEKWRNSNGGERQRRHLLHFWSSSEPSPQSSEPSHTQWEEMQRWLAHSNWVDVQNLSAKDAKENLFQVFSPDCKSGFPCEKRSWKKNRGCFQEEH